VTLRRARAIAEALFSRGGTLPPTTRVDWLIAELEDFLARAGTRSRLMLALSITAVGLFAPLFVRRVVGIERLSLADRITALTRLEDRFPPPVLAVKALLCLLYFEHPDAAREVGFDGECARPASRSIEGGAA
jgi:hypothetical protein